MRTNQLFNEDCLTTMKRMPDNSVDLIFTDPPYALGSKVIIAEDGKPDYKKAVDFMNKWDMPTAEFWEQWYKETFRILKHGGHCLLFGLDRQLLLFKYYGAFAGFTEKQSLYWYFISNLPKASDLSKNLDKRLGKKREVVVLNKTMKKRSPNPRKKKGQNRNYGVDNRSGNDFKITKPNSEIAKKYDGYKYSIAPLKQTNETIMVFQKPYKTGSCLHDTIALENGDNEITCGALDIKRNRVGTQKRQNIGQPIYLGKTGTFAAQNEKKKRINKIVCGRFPSQTFLSPESAEILDKQSGIVNNAKRKPLKKAGTIDSKVFKGINKGSATPAYADIAGCSKSCHITPYEQGDFDIYNYSPKTSVKERNRGVENNNHPTVKPLRLLRHVLSYFNTPNHQVIFDAFMGSGSIGMACAEFEGMEYIGSEIDKEYFEIARRRIKHARSKNGNLLEWRTLMRY